MPDLSTEVPLATTVLSSTANSITFSSISGSYTDLRLVISGGATWGNINYCNHFLTLNSDSSTLYSYTSLQASPNGAASSRASALTKAEMGYMTDDIPISPIYSVFIVDLLSYANTAINKTVLSSWASGQGTVYSTLGTRVNLWRNTAAITSITVAPGDTPFRIGTTATLYGIL